MRALILSFSGREGWKQCDMSKQSLGRTYSIPPPPFWMSCCSPYLDYVSKMNRTLGSQSHRQIRWPPSSTGLAFFTADSQAGEQTNKQNLKRSVKPSLFIVTVSLWCLVALSAPEGKIFFQGHSVSEFPKLKGILFIQSLIFSPHPLSCTPKDLDTDEKMWCK